MTKHTTHHRAPSFKQEGLITYPDKTTENSKFTVTKSHKLLGSQTLLSTREQKLLAACISLINPQGDYPNGITVQLKDTDIEKLTAIKKRFIYRFIDDAAKKFHSIPIETPGKKAGSIDYINIALRSNYDPDTRTFTVIFHPDMEEELLKLSRYASYELINITKLKSKYAIRLYELFSRQYNTSINGTQFFRVKIEDIHYPLGLTNVKGHALFPAYTKSFGTFRKRIIDPSCKEINKHTNFNITYKTQYTGRYITSLVFTIAQKNEKQIPSNEQFNLDLKPLEQDTHEPLNLEKTLKNLNIPEVAINRFLSLYSEETIKANVLECISKIENGTKIKSPAAYLSHMLKHDIANLPEIANPFSMLHKTNKSSREFCNRIIVKIWWKLPRDLQEELSEIKSFSHCLRTAKIFESFTQIAKKSTYDEAEALYDPDFVLESLIENLDPQVSPLT